ncbi:hypothetical protein [Deinococcus yavapaiensis]|uniref:ZU5 domain-containing protein n=1 Tax=Deinococcus yavapaiensis KR-236 TaxID=694435 RepID=A0A318S5B8_9DEIO|nr:hypothetical protein [Deinococcus yavapaiensis]PYE53884.1 hypothetical protein DES52_107142 [Deinococcus yavapaiensis KR-236]
MLEHPRRSLLFLGVLAATTILAQSAVTPATTAPGGEVGDATTRIIGPAGGTVSSDDGLIELVIPSGALSQPTEVGIQAITNEAPSAVGNAYRFTPKGQKLAKPATVKIEYDSNVVTGTTEGLRLAYQDASGAWKGINRVPGVNAEKQEVSAELDFFADWGLYKQWKLVPERAAVQLGDPLDLEVVTMSAPCPASAKECSLTFDERHFDVGVLGWTVNGVRGGNTLVGRVMSGQSSMGVTYVAPDAMPPGNPVSVAVQLDLASAGGYGTLTLASRVQILRNVCQPPGDGYQGCDYKGLRVDGSPFAYALPRLPGEESDTYYLDVHAYVSQRDAWGEPPVLYLKHWLYDASTGFHPDRRDGLVPLTTDLASLTATTQFSADGEDSDWSDEYISGSQGTIEFTGRGDDVLFHFGDRTYRGTATPWEIRIHDFILIEDRPPVTVTLTRDKRNIISGGGR